MSNKVALDEPVETSVKYSSPEPRQLTILRRHIENNEYEEVEEMIWENPRYLVTVCDSAVYLMAGPKYNACHIAARSNKPEIMALILDTISNTNFLRKLYPDESVTALQDRVNHLLDSYLNTPDPRQGNTPLQFACKLGHHRVARVLLTFEACDQNIRDSQGRTAEECICLQKEDTSPEIKKKLKDMFKSPLHLPIHRDQLKKRLSILKKLNQAKDSFTDISFSDDSFFSPSKIKTSNKTPSKQDDLHASGEFLAPLNYLNNKNSDNISCGIVNVTNDANRNKVHRDTPMKLPPTPKTNDTSKDSKQDDDIDELTRRLQALKQ